VETPEERIRRVTQEDVAIVPYDPDWPEQFRLEEAHLRSCFGSDLVTRIEHFGSTAVPGLAAKPIIDILVEVTSLEATRTRIVPVLEAQGYEYFWRPTRGEQGEPFYAWFVKRHPISRARTHHVHMVEKQFVDHWERLLFRDYLVQHPDVAREYDVLKRQLAAAHPKDRIAYTRGKGEFIERVTALAKQDTPDTNRWEP
jgi:GrpB-like predicted nucleotidyltransferase (UPF0157 family)